MSFFRFITKTFVIMMHAKISHKTYGTTKRSNDRTVFGSRSMRIPIAVTKVSQHEMSEPVKDMNLNWRSGNMKLKTIFRTNAANVRRECEYK